LDRLGRVSHWPNTEAREWVEGFTQVACQDGSTAALVVLGSMVRPVDSVQDVDLLHVFHGKKVKLPGRPLSVDLWAYPAADVPRLIAGGNDIIGWALKYGHLICERGGFWTLLAREWLPKLPFPSAAVARQRAARAGALYEEMRGIGDLAAAHEQRMSQLTHLARACLLSHGVYPASRPELPTQLLRIQEQELAQQLLDALRERDGGAIRAIPGTATTS
jgi:hypothetical protein